MPAAVAGRTVPAGRTGGDVRGLSGALAIALTLALGAAVPASATEVSYRRPVGGAVVARFAAPATYGPGHRGVDLEAVVGERVLAAAGGQVAFAGSVADQRWVSVDHADGIRTSYGPLLAVSVHTGGRVARGTVVGTVAGGHRPGGPTVLHWGARRGAAYLDPLSLLGPPEPWRPTLVGPGGWQVTDEPVVPRYRRWPGWHLPGFVDGSPVASGPGWVLPANPNHVIGVAGLDSYTGREPIDLTHLGYTTADITYLSYRGRHDGDADAADPHRDQLPYEPSDTWAGVQHAAELLRDQLRVQYARRPDQAVDLVGHSMGGLVVMHYLLTMHDPADPTLPPVAHAVTMASPLEGADLASALLRAQEGPLSDLAIDQLSAALGLDADSQAIDDLAVGSPVVREVAGAWLRALVDPWRSPLATGTQVLSIGASRDLVVTEHRSDLPGMDHVILPGSHDGMRLTEASRIVVHEFLADRPVPSSGGLVPHLLSYPLGFAEQLVGGAVGRLGGDLLPLG